MANDCDYKVRITGEPENLTKLNQSLKCEEIETKGSLHADNYNILFESCEDVEDWGSKWTVFSNIEYYEGDSMMFIEGYSAWSPTEGLWKKISKDFEVSLECEYSERGMDFAGITRWNDGEEIAREEMTYWEYMIETDTEYFWEEIGYQCEWDSLEGVKETLSSIWNKLTEEEIQKIEEIHKERYSE
jgi:hypothetical protein